MGKGDTQRPRQIGAEEYNARWNATFGKNQCEAVVYGNWASDTSPCICSLPNGHGGEHVCGCGNAWSNLGDPK